MAAVVLGRQNLMELLFGNFISFAFHMRFEVDPVTMSNPEDVTVDETNRSSLSAIMSDLLMTYTDLFTNDLNLVKSLVSLLWSNEKTSKWTLELEEFDSYIKRAMLEYAIVSTPCTGSKIFELLSGAVLSKRVKIAEFFEGYLDRDPSSQMCKVKDRIFQKTQLSSLDLMRHWPDLTNFEMFTEFFNLQPKGQLNAVNVALGSSKLATAIAEQADHESFFGAMQFLCDLVSKMGRWNSICTTFFRALNLHLQLITAHPESVTEEEKNQYLDQIARWVVVAKTHVDQTEQKPIEDFLLVLAEFSHVTVESLKIGKSKSRISESALAAQETLNEKAGAHSMSKDKFKEKSARLLSRIAKKKVQFFEGAAEETKRVVEQMTKESSSALTCALTNNPIDETGQHFLIVRVHMSNVVLDLTSAEKDSRSEHYRCDPRRGC